MLLQSLVYSGYVLLVLSSNAGKQFTETVLHQAGGNWREKAYQVKKEQYLLSLNKFYGLILNSIDSDADFCKMDSRFLFQPPLGRLQSA